MGAVVRGIWFSMAADHVRRIGRAESLAWQRVVYGRRRLPFLSYPLREYIEELATAAAIVHPNDPGEGMREIWRDAASTYVATPFGRSLVRLFKPNPLRPLEWLAAHRDHFCNYGTWRVVRHADHYVTMEMHDEFIWLQHAHRGGAEGLLAACGVSGTVEPEQSGPYEGRIHVRWEPHRSS